MNIAWHRFIALVLLVMGVWLELVFGVLFAFYAPAERAPLENAVGGVFIALGLGLGGLSYFIARRRNWARLTVIFCLVVACLATVILVLKRVITEGLHSPDDVGEFLIGVGLLIFPAASTLFLINKPVVDEFREGNTGNG